MTLDSVDMPNRYIPPLLANASFSIKQKVNTLIHSVTPLNSFEVSFLKFLEVKGHVHLIRFMWF